jgi:hypothetical protein
MPEKKVEWTQVYTSGVACHCTCYGQRTLKGKEKHGQKTIQTILGMLGLLV